MQMVLACLETHHWLSHWLMGLYYQIMLKNLQTAGLMDQGVIKYGLLCQMEKQHLSLVHFLQVNSIAVDLSV
jgi:hypothetical protein